MFALLSGIFTVRAASWDGRFFAPAVTRGNSTCDTFACVPTDSLALQAGEDSSTNAFLRDAAFVLSVAGRHGAAARLLEEGMRRYGEDRGLRLLEGDEFFADGHFESALGLNYAMERHFPGDSELFLAQRLRFFRALGMDKEARQTEALLRPIRRQMVLPNWSGWYSFEMEDSRVHYEPVRSRIQELASEITRGTPPAAVSGNLDTVRVYGRVKTHSAGATWTWRGESGSLRIEPWGRLNLDAGADTLTQWAGGTRLSWTQGLRAGILGLSASLSRTAYFPDGMRNDAGLSASWTRYVDNGYWRVSASGSRSASVSLVGESSVRYSQGGIAFSGRHSFPHGLSLSGSLGLSAFLGPESRSMDSVAKVVDVSGMRDTVLYLRELRNLPSWLSVYDTSGNSWTPGFRGIYGIPTRSANVPFAEVSPSSSGGPSLEASLSWSPIARASLFVTGGVSWKIWFERTRWSIAMLGKNSASDEITLWHDRETGKWYLMEPHTSQGNDIDRRVLPFDVFVRRREDLDCSGTIGATLDLGRSGTLTASWNFEQNWSTIENKDSDENAWDSRAFSLAWSVSF